MARFYAQVFTIIFLAAGIAGFFLRNASHIDDTYFSLAWQHNVADIAIAAVLAYVSFIADRRTGRIVVGALGGILVLLTVVMTIWAFSPPSSCGEAMHCPPPGIGPVYFSLPLNILDGVAGVLGVLAALGTVETPEPPARPFLS